MVTEAYNRPRSSSGLACSDWQDRHTHIIREDTLQSRVDPSVGIVKSLTTRCERWGVDSERKSFLFMGRSAYKIKSKNEIW